jgi:hypothetical protein
METGQLTKGGLQGGKNTHEVILSIVPGVCRRLMMALVSLSPECVKIEMRVSVEEPRQKDGGIGPHRGQKTY